ncbi:hypothetical protein C1N81_30455 [Streptomyces sp. SGAir0957]
MRPAGARAASAARAAGFAVAALLHRRFLGLPLRGERLRVGAHGVGGGAAPRAGEGSVEVPAARVAVVHDVGRLRARAVTEKAGAVKLLCETRRSEPLRSPANLCADH